MLLLLSFISFLLICYLSFYLSGRAAINLLKIKLESDKIFILSWFVGICLFLIVSYIFAWLNTNYLTYFILLILLTYSYKKKVILPGLNSLRGIDYWSLLIVLLGTLSFLSITFFSGMKTQQGMQFIGYNSIDGIAHLSYIKTLLENFPPTHPGLANIPFRGYHYFYDFLISRFTMLYGFSPEDLFFRFFPFLISLVYGAGFFLITSSMKASTTAKRMVLFLAYFSQSFAYLLIPLSKNYSALEAGQLVQPIGLPIAPSLMLSIGILLTALAFLPRVKDSLKYALVSGLMLGILAQTKVYTGILGIAAITIYTGYIFYRYRTKYILNYIYAIFITGLITAITFLPNNLGAGKLIFEPLLIYKNYIEQPIFNTLQWELKRQIFTEHNNYLRIILLYAQAFSVFWIVNLGIRIIPLFYIPRIFSVKFWRNDYNVILFICSIIALIIPSFFIQSISVFDIKQFLWILLPLMCIPTGIILGEILKSAKLPIKAFLILILIVTIAQNIIYINSYLWPKKSFVISKNNLELYNMISKDVSDKEFIISLPINEFSPPIISAMTGKSVYFENEIIKYPLEKEYKDRKYNLTKLMGAINSCDSEEISRQIKIINSKYLLTEFKNPCLATHSAVLRTTSVKNNAFYIFK
jgi:hypothetical protein